MENQIEQPKLKRAYLVSINYDDPYPKTFSATIEARKAGRAVDFAIRKLALERPKKREPKELRVKVIKL